MIEIGFIFGLAIYGIIWFLTLFMVLPWGVVSQAEYGEVQPGSSESAPARPLIWQKLAITTGLSGSFLFDCLLAVDQRRVVKYRLAVFSPTFRRDNKKAGPKTEVLSRFKCVSDKVRKVPPKTREHRSSLIHAAKIIVYSPRCHPFFTFL